MEGLGPDFCSLLAGVFWGPQKKIRQFWRGSGYEKGWGIPSDIHILLGNFHP